MCLALLPALPGRPASAGSHAARSPIPAAACRGLSLHCSPNAALRRWRDKQRRPIRPGGQGWKQAGVDDDCPAPPPRAAVGRRPHPGGAPFLAAMASLAAAQLSSARRVTLRVQPKAPRAVRASRLVCRAAAVSLRAGRALNCKGSWSESANPAAGLLSSGAPQAWANGCPTRSLASVREVCRRRHRAGASSPPLPSSLNPWLPCMLCRRTRRRCCPTCAALLRSSWARTSTRSPPRPSEGRKLV